MRHTRTTTLVSLRTPVSRHPLDCVKGRRQLGATNSSPVVHHYQKKSLAPTEKRRGPSSLAEGEREKESVQSEHKEALYPALPVLSCLKNELAVQVLKVTDTYCNSAKLFSRCLISAPIKNR